MFPFYTPWNHQKTKGLLVFSDGIKWEHWAEKDQLKSLYITHSCQPTLRKEEKLGPNFCLKMCYEGFSMTLTRFKLLFSFHTTWKHKKTSGFLIFSGGIERDKWHEQG